MCALVRPCAMVSCSEKVHIQLTTRFGLSVLNCSIYLKLKWPNMIQDGAWWYQLMNFQNAECPKWWMSKMLNVQMMNVFEPFWNCTIPKTKIIKNTLKSFHWHHLVLCTWHQLVPPAGPNGIKNFNPGIFRDGILPNPGIPGFFGMGFSNIFDPGI